jgi:hypothetical protein
LFRSWNTVPCYAMALLRSYLLNRRIKPNLSQIWPKSRCVNGRLLFQYWYWRFTARN